VLQLNRKVPRRPYVLSRVVIAASCELHSNVCLQHSLCVGNTRAYIVKRRMASRIEYGLSERD
jgi:hypothetical protein